MSEKQDLHGSKLTEEECNPIYNHRLQAIKAQFEKIHNQFTITLWAPINRVTFKKEPQNHTPETFDNMCDAITAILQNGINEINHLKFLGSQIEDIE